MANPSTSMDLEEEVEEEERVTAHSYGAIDGSLASSDCWLIRLPPAIAEVWESVPEGTELGELVFTKGGGGANSGNGTKGGGGTSAAAAVAAKPSVTVHVNEDLLETAKQHRRKHHEKQQVSSNSSKSNKNQPKSLPGVLPLHYGLQAMTKKVPVLHPFSRNPANGSVKMWGVVSRTANLQVTQDVQYRALLKDRLVTSNITGNRYVKPVEASESIMSHNPAAAATPGAASAETAAAVASSSTSTLHPGNNPNLSTSAADKKSFGNAISRIGKRLLEAQEMAHNSSSSAAALALQQSNKRARQFSPDQPLRSVVFELFQLQERWAVKDLRMAAVAGGAALANAKRAETEIRDILREIGEYHRSGDYKNLWELKREFQTQSQQQLQGQAGGAGGGAASSSQAGAGGASLKSE